MKRTPVNPENEEEIEKSLAKLDQPKKGDPVFTKGNWSLSKFTPNNIAIILNKLLEGYPLNLALAEARITLATYKHWSQQCDAGVKRYGSFNEVIEIAKGRGVARLHRQLLTLSQEDWKATLEILKALNPDIYSEKKVVSNLHNGTIKIEYVDIGDREDPK